MSHDLLLYSPCALQSCLDDWLAALREQGMSCEIDPLARSHLETTGGYAGFWPLAVRFSSTAGFPHERRYDGLYLHTGFELYVDQWTSHSDVPYGQDEAVDRRLARTQQILNFVVQRQGDSAQVRAAWLCAAALGALCDGVLCDTESDIFYTGEQLYRAAAAQISAYERSVTARDWQVIPFTGFADPPVAAVASSPPVPSANGDIALGLLMLGSAVAWLTVGSFLEDAPLIRGIVVIAGVVLGLYWLRMGIRKKRVARRT
jgi:hypothetical protein